MDPQGAASMLTSSCSDWEPIVSPAIVAAPTSDYSFSGQAAAGKYGDAWECFNRDPIGDSPSVLTHQSPSQDLLYRGLFPPTLRGHATRFLWIFLSYLILLSHYSGFIVPMYSSTHYWPWCLWALSVLAVHGAAEERVQYLQRAQMPGLWEQRDYEIQQAWLRETNAHVLANPRELHPAVAELRDLIEGDSRIYLLASAMYQGIPDNFTDPSDLPVIRSYGQMLRVMSHLLTTAPVWSQHESEIGLVGVPMHALFDWPMGTFAGAGFFFEPQVNAVLKKVLDTWADYLRSPASADVLNGEAAGWLGPEGLRALTARANVGGSAYAFEELFVCEPGEKYHGFASWDDFFTRRFHDARRPVAAPDNDSVVVNACESFPFELARNVKRRDEFWTKGQPYSVQDMLGGNALSEQFVGGTIFQAYLDSMSYHRWHAPVSGRIVKVVKFDGTYFSEPLFEVLGHYGAHPYAPRHAQGYLSVVAARTVVYIMADNSHIGLVAMVLVGMSEVSSCEVLVKEDQKVKKGDEIGMFHFGGSSWCLLLRKGVKATAFPQPGVGTENIPVRSSLAVVEELTSASDEL